MSVRYNRNFKEPNWVLIYLLNRALDDSPFAWEALDTARRSLFLFVSDLADAISGVRHHAPLTGEPGTGFVIKPMTPEERRQRLEELAREEQEARWWANFEPHQRAAIIAAAAVIAVAFLPLIGLLSHGAYIYDYRVIRTWAYPILLGTSVAGVLVTIAFWLKR